ncbi:MAG: deoxyribodipyrimidine photo-lyase, partial [Flavobacteriaceae bacterium]|nr:deoxyribodipyrimidine photo-lyase [Flavobacteriaceae bacterium]
MTSIAVFWFRRDLRLNDNHGLYQALQSGYKVKPIFIFDQDILKRLPKDDARLTFIFDQLQSIRRQLQNNYNSSVALYYGKPSEIFEQLIQKHTINTVFTNHDYEPYARKRDEEIRKLLHNNSIAFKTFKDQVIFEKDEVSKADGNPYVVYTPYMKKWKERFRKQRLQFFPSEDHLDQLLQEKNLNT